jgi:hypothetical protein
MQRVMAGNQCDDEEKEKWGGNNILSKDAYSDAKPHASDQVEGHLAAHQDKVGTSPQTRL